MLGVYTATKKDGTVYFRSSITCHAKHISLGSFSKEEDANQAYREADKLLSCPALTIDLVPFPDFILSYEKQVVLCNFRDNHIYIKNPIYLFRSYFNYYLSPTEIYKFDIDDLFYFSEHKLHKRGGHLYVNDYGMQVTILSRFGIRSFAVAGKDYKFANQDMYDYRYSNIININPFHGVERTVKNGTVSYDTHIHIKGNIHVGNYPTLTEAAIAYNKASDLAKNYGIQKNFPSNYITEMTPEQYASAYEQVALVQSYLPALLRCI